MKLSLATLFLASFFGSAAAVAKNDAPDEFKVALWGDLVRANGTIESANKYCLVPFSSFFVKRS